jgi:hypothetical protein
VGVTKEEISTYTYYPGTGGSVSTTTKPVYIYNQGLFGTYFTGGAFWSNVVTSVSGGGGGSYEWKTDYDSTVDPYNMGQTYGAPRRNCVGNMYNSTTNCGTRSMQCNTYPYVAAAYATTRGCNGIFHFHLSTNLYIKLSIQL